MTEKYTLRLFYPKTRVPRLAGVGSRLVGMVLGARWGPFLAIESTSISPKSAHFILFLLSQHPKLGLVQPHVAAEDKCRKSAEDVERGLPLHLPEVPPAPLTSPEPIRLVSPLSFSYWACRGGRRSHTPEGGHSGAPSMVSWWQIHGDPLFSLGI
jgi:hypothetical protein